MNEEIFMGMADSLFQVLYRAFGKWVKNNVDSCVKFPEEFLISFQIVSTELLLRHYFSMIKDEKDIIKQIETFNINLKKAFEVKINEKSNNNETNNTH